MKFTNLFSKSKSNAKAKLGSNSEQNQGSNHDKSESLSAQKQQLRQALNDLSHPLFPNGIYGQIAIGLNNDTFEVELPILLGKLAPEITGLLQQQTQLITPIKFTYKPTVTSKHQIENIKLVVAVASGKGGVGKSTVTTNLAVCLAQQGVKVGVLDADIYGPSVPIMFGLAGKSITSKDGKTMEPFERFGVSLNSIGFVVPEDKATIWRGPMASKALMQVINETNWPELDVLLVDMPPGTGDIQLTMSENIKCDGALIVTTPQNVALADAEKGINMFNKVNTPILGLVENMSQFICDGCGKTHYLFGQNGGRDCANKHNVALLAQLPLLPVVRECADEGTPYAVNKAATDENSALEYHQLAFSLMMQLSKQTESVITLG
ncbi:Mrp/NBP35 family ATP-binding protein [uncultured Psychrosphaera sp.]|uniref:Mrp/NBP35 family ATP-binding protein n=1 Tax=uncultured Psychrosphaera sp. TaxID=1403522 RepID=UPI00263291E1|nr:Mrp/NBP35 family ATP-binding protein [uncultured Psychrosphaera sp.]